MRHPKECNSLAKPLKNPLLTPTALPATTQFPASTSLAVSLWRWWHPRANSTHPLPAYWLLDIQALYEQNTIEEQPSWHYQSTYSWPRTENKPHSGYPPGFWQKWLSGSNNKNRVKFSKNEIVVLFPEKLNGMQFLVILLHNPRSILLSQKPQHFHLASLT